MWVGAGFMIMGLKMSRGGSSGVSVVLNLFISGLPDLALGYFSAHLLQLR